MKKSLRDKFKENANFVKPLYRKVKFGNRVRPMKKLFVSVDINGDTKPYGDGLHVKGKIVTNKSVNYNVNRFNSDNSGYSRHKTDLPGACDKRYQGYKSRDPIINFKVRKNAFETYNLLGANYMKMEEDFAATNSKLIQTKNSAVLIEKVPETWLRIYPAPQIPHESTLSVIFRCLVCQFGLAAFLVLWTVLWVFVIQHFEGPFETEVSIQFEKEQNQLVIDLATELRQITPLSPKWKNAIEKRIEDERLLTMMAMARGAKLHPGQFWDLSGTFLFSIYVMTALGFGAPVPQTSWGRSSALIYAILAVPTHIYLMVNASTCVVAKVEAYFKKMRRNRTREHSINNGNAAIDAKDGPSSSGNSELIQSEKNKNYLRRKIQRILTVLYFGRCVPAAMAVYYACGALAFGVLRGRLPLETIMFPLEFTTTGGLENVESYVRVSYGFYVEGAMALLSCALATLRAQSSDTTNFMSKKYRLFTINKEQ